MAWSVDLEAASISTIIKLKSEHILRVRETLLSSIFDVKLLE